MQSNMKRIMYIAIGIAFIAILGTAGNYDWAEEVLESVPYELYQIIKKDIGSSNEVDIARQYMDNRHHYDSIAKSNGWK